MYLAYSQFFITGTLYKGGGGGDLAMQMYQHQMCNKTKLICELYISSVGDKTLLLNFLVKITFFLNKLVARKQDVVMSKL